MWLNEYYFIMFGNNKVEMLKLEKNERIDEAAKKLALKLGKPFEVWDLTAHYRYSVRKDGTFYKLED